MPYVNSNGAQLNHPLLDRLHGIDEFIRENGPLSQNTDPGLGCVGLILLSELENGGYWCSPRNALTFAHTGGDGDHYSLLIKDGVIDESSPVVLTWASEGNQFIVGESLHDFLCFGMHGGYFQILTGIYEQPTAESSGLLFHENVEEHQRRVIQVMADKLALQPWPHEDRKSRYKSLQDRFLPLVDSSDDLE